MEGKAEVVNRMEVRLEKAEIDDAIQDPEMVYSKDRLELTTLGALISQADMDSKLLNSLDE